MYSVYSLLTVLLFIVMSPYFVYQAMRYQKYVGSLRERLGYLPIAFNLDGEESIIETVRANPGIVLVTLSSTFLGFTLGAVLLGVGTAMVYPTLLAAVGDVDHERDASFFARLQVRDFRGFPLHVAVVSGLGQNHKKDEQIEGDVAHRHARHIGLHRSPRDFHVSCRP